MSQTGDSSSFVEEPASPEARQRELERQVLGLEYRLRTEHSEAEMARLALERELAGMQGKYKQCMGELEAALADTRYLYEQNAALEARARAADEDAGGAAAAERAAAAEERARAAEARARELEEALQAARGEAAAAGRAAAGAAAGAAAAEQSGLLRKYEAEIERQMGELRALAERLAEREDEVAGLKAQRVLQAHRSYSAEEVEELGVLRRTLQEQLALSKELERANLEQANELKRLRQRSESQQFLQLENSKLRARLEKTDALRQQLDDLQLENVQLQEKLTKWEVYQADGSSPENVLHEMALAKQERLALVEQVGKLQLDLNNMKILNDELALERNQLLDLNKKYESSILNLKKLNYEIEQQKLLSFEECKLLRQQLDDLSEVDKDHTPDTRDRKKIQTLVDTYKNQTEDLTNELKKLNEQLLERSDLDGNPRKRRKASDDLAFNYSQRLNELQLRNKDLERRLANSDENASLLEEKLRKLQSLNEKKIRILQLRNNPLLKDQFVKQKQLTLLKQENLELAQQLDAQQGLEAVPRSVYERQQYDIQLLEDELFSINKRTTRLKEMFNRKSLEFIDAVNSLLGFKLEFQVGGKVKMIPCFKTDRYLIADLQTNTLKSNLDKVMPEWDAMLAEYVGKRQQLPCFLAKIMLLLAESSSSQ